VVSAPCVVLVLVSPCNILLFGLGATALGLSDGILVVALN
jgi:hypothetical protein